MTNEQSNCCKQGLIVTDPLAPITYQMAILQQFTPLQLFYARSLPCLSEVL